MNQPEVAEFRRAASHRHRPILVGYAGTRRALEYNRRESILRPIRIHASLDHLDLHRALRLVVHLHRPMEHPAVVMAGIDVAEEIVGRPRRALRIELEDDVPELGLHANANVALPPWPAPQRSTVHRRQQPSATRASTPAHAPVAPPHLYRAPVAPVRTRPHLEPICQRELELPARPDRTSARVLAEPGIRDHVDVPVGDQVELVERVEDIGAELDAVLADLEEYAPASGRCRRSNRRARCCGHPGGPPGTRGGCTA